MLSRKLSLGSSVTSRGAARPRACVAAVSALTPHGSGSFLMEPDRIPHHDARGRRLYESGQPKLVEGARHDLSARGDRVGQLLLSRPRNEGAVVGVNGQVKELPRHPLAHAQKRLVGDLLEGPEQLLSELFGAGPRHGRVGFEQRPEHVDTQGHDRGTRQGFDRYRGWTPDDERKAHNLAAARIPDRDLPTIGRTHVRPQQPMEHDDRAATLLITVDDATRGDIDPNRVGEKAQGGARRESGKEARRDYLLRGRVTRAWFVLHRSNRPYQVVTTLAHPGAYGNALPPVKSVIGGNP
jgi:hypothetical protein